MKHKIFAVLSVAAALLLSCTEKPVDQHQDQPGDLTAPELPADPQPESTSFAHKIMLIQHTGTYCPNCPRLMESLKELSEIEDYNGKYCHVAAHSYNETGDPAYCQAAANLSQAFCSGYYPELTFNLTKKNTGTSLAVSAITEVIDELHRDSADAGIAAAVKNGGDALAINVQVKAAKTNQYRIAAWILEDGIKAKQEGAFQEWMNTHGNAVRAMAGATLNLRIYGEKVGELQEGKTAEKSFVVPVEEAWNVENCKVLVIVNAARSDGRYDLVNCAVCPVGGTIEYQYM